MSKSTIPLSVLHGLVLDASRHCLAYVNERGGVDPHRLIVESEAAAVMRGRYEAFHAVALAIEGDATEMRVHAHDL